MSAILYVLRTGIQWNALPRELGASTTVYDRFRLWEQQGVFERIWQAGLQDYDELEGIAWEWQSMDGVMTKAPFGGAATGANPTDRSKRGTKRSQLSDGRGMPLAVMIAGANRNDMKLVEGTLEGVMIARPTPTEEEPQHLCLDAGYDYETVYETAERISMCRIFVLISTIGHTCRTGAGAKNGGQQQFGVYEAASPLGGGEHPITIPLRHFG